jgi:hypothetical protein
VPQAAELECAPFRYRHGMAEEDEAPPLHYVEWVCLCCGVDGPGTERGPGLIAHHGECPERGLPGDSEEVRELKAKVAYACRRLNEVTRTDAEGRARKLEAELERVRLFYATNYPPPCHTCFAETTFAPDFSAYDLFSYRCGDCQRVFTRPPLA